MKLLVGCSVICLCALLPAKGFSQHYADLTPNDGKNISVKKIKKSIVSFGFFSPLNQHISFGYDQIIGTDLILSSQIGIIGPGLNTTNTFSNSNSIKGAFLEIGPKLFFSPTWTMDGMRRVNAMQGGYFKPEFVVSSFSESYNNYYSRGSTTYTGMAVILNIGHQWVFANSFTLDMYFGIGYNISATNGAGGGNSLLNNEPSDGNYYSYETSSIIAFTAGLNLGVPF